MTLHEKKSNKLILNNKIEENTKQKYFKKKPTKYYLNK